MATAAVVTQPNITVLPAGPERRELHFDQHTGIRPKLPVSAEFDGHDFQSTGISFSDYRVMHTSERKLAPGRRLETPEYANDDRLLRKVIAAYLEARAGFKKQRAGTERERVDHAMKSIAKRTPAYQAVLRNMCAEYVVLKQNGSDPYRLKKLSEIIENYDTQLRLQLNIASIVAAVAYNYYRLGMDSVGVADELNLKPPHVRVILWRLARTWERMTGQRPARIARIKRTRRVAVPKPRGRHSNLDVELAKRLIAEGKSRTEQAVALGYKNDGLVKALKRAGIFQQMHSGRPRENRVTQVARSCESTSGAKPVDAPQQPSVAAHPINPNSKCKTLKPETLAKHVAIMGKLAQSNGGLLPTYAWLNANGYFFSYEVMRKNPGAFAHIQRERLR